MTDFDVNSAAYWERRFEGDWELAGGGAQTRYFGRLLQDHMPEWLKRELRRERLVVCDWGCAQGEAVGLLSNELPECSVVGIDRSENAIQIAREKYGSQRFAARDLLAEPPTQDFDVIVASNVLEHFDDPWATAANLGRHAKRHLVVLVPYDERDLFGEHKFSFVAHTIAFHVGSDFSLSFWERIDCSQHADRMWPGWQILLVYSREPYYPSRPADVPAAARELWTKLSDAETQGIQDQLRRANAEVARLRELNRRLVAENQMLSVRASASAWEASQLRSANNDLRRSLSWRVTAPLRLAAKPVLRRLSARTDRDAVGTPEREKEQAMKLEPVLAQLRRATSAAIITCSVPFTSGFNQRPISWARYLGQRGITVLFVAWQWSPNEEVSHAFEEVDTNIYQIPLYAFQGNAERIALATHGRSSYICTLPTRGLVAAIRPLRAHGYHIHYDILYDWEEFHRGGEAPWHVPSVEHELIQSADTITAVTNTLARKFARLRSDIHLLRNGYHPAALATEQFIAARARLTEPKTVGYFGHLSDAWFDWDAVLEAAAALKDVQFELIGYSLSESSRVRMERHPNVRFLGLIPQCDLHEHVRRWWAAMIPFQASALSAAVDPLKVYEYLHFGLPVLAKGIPEVADYPLLQVLPDNASLISAIRSIKDRPDEQRLVELAAFLKTCTWEERLRLLDRLISEQPGLQPLYAT
jgi:glycosyltransferase involved in cell wall biosynthesis